MVRTGLGNRCPRIALPALSYQVKAKFSRNIINGSFGCWRKSDVCDLSLNQFDFAGSVQHTRKQISNCVSGIPTSQSSIESINARAKHKLNRPKESSSVDEIFYGLSKRYSQ